ncbi:MAG: hypothetical protein PHO91_04280 [Patescibacteria group bacterium]|nr:hypothetical protein [Patescibacteria group bacterium]
MKGTFFFCIMVAFFGWLLVSAVDAADNDSVTATVTAQNIAISLSQTSFDYGIVPNNTASSTLALFSGAGIVATNDGNINQDFDINGANTADWTLAGSTGSDQYVHQFCNDTDNNCATPPTNYSALTTSPAALKTSISPSGTCAFQLRITTPNPSTVYTQQSASVTVTASAS